jgi:hypothetical protein
MDRKQQPELSAIGKAALDIATSNNWRVFPCSPLNKGPMIPKSEGGHGFKDATSEPNVIIEMWTKYPNAMIGVATGAASGFFAVDLDKKPNMGDGLSTWRQWEIDAKVDPVVTRQHKTPSTGRHMLFCYIPGVSSVPLGKLGEGVEIKGDGGYIIVPPSVMSDGAEYKCITDRDTDIYNAPEFLLVRLRDYYGKYYSDDEERGKGTPISLSEIEEALFAIPCKDLDYSTWMYVGASLYKELGDKGKPLFLKWSEKDKARFKPGEVNRKWKDEVPKFSKLTVGTLFHYANMYDPEWRNRWKEKQQKEYLRGLGVWDAGEDAKVPPPRGWLFGNIFARCFISSLFGDGGVGKTALRYTQLMSCAIGRSLTGDHVFQRCRVLIISLEDDADELRRRILALRLHYGIEAAELKGWLFLSAPGAAGGKILIQDNRGGITQGTLAGAIEAEIVKHKIDIVSIDPFVKSHGVEENSNSMIDNVIQILSDLAIKHNIAMDTPHHTRKGTQDAGNASTGRGAGAMKDAARLVYTLTPMSADEGKAMGVAEEDRRSLVRMDSGKVNIAPPMRLARWYKLVGVRLGNQNKMYPNGDEVQAIETWQPPNIWQGINDDVVSKILTDIEKGLEDGNRYTDTPTAKERAAWPVVVKHAKIDEGPAREIIKAWLRTGMLYRENYQNPATRKPVSGLRVDQTKKPGQQDMGF